MNTKLNILMVTAENDALPGGKVGGIGDVVRDVPPALAAQGCRVHVITPAYRTLARYAGAKHSASIPVSFAGVTEHVSICEVVAESACEGVTHWVIDHPAFSAGGDGRIYSDDGPNSPFATDATRFARFCTAVATLVEQAHFGSLDIIHLHDWHSALLLVLRHYHEHYRFLQKIRCVYTIHNLALQGIRPLRDHESSLDAWYPGINIDAAVTDQRWPDCINLMRSGINLADKVHAVSPTYAREILQPSAVDERGYFGGEGLETDLQRAADQGRLVGILNGCEYPQEAATEGLEHSQLAALMSKELWRWIGRERHVSTAHFVAERRLRRFASRDRPLLITSVGRVTDQKMRLLQQRLPDGKTALEALLECLGQSGSCVFLGSGDEQLENFLTSVSAQFENFIFLRGYSDSIANALYQSGDLFLMPSSFEPCGISQMLAMRAGQPCLVHQVGGLNDTVQDGENGLSFAGNTPLRQAQALLQAFELALDCMQKKPQQWEAIRQQAALSRFTWQSSITRYLSELYQ